MTGNARYRSGYHFERRVSAHLRNDGYFVIEARGSHGALDQVAVKPYSILGVQCKTDGVLSPADWNSLYDLSQAHGFVPLLACREGIRLAYYQLLGHKVKWDRNPPRRPWTADQVAA